MPLTLLTPMACLCFRIMITPHVECMVTMQYKCLVCEWQYLLTRCILLSKHMNSCTQCYSGLQGRLARTVFAAWMQAAESGCLQREEVEREVVQRANTRHLSMAFAGWSRLHQVCKQDAQRVSLCARCGLSDNDMQACRHA